MSRAIYFRGTEQQAIQRLGDFVGQLSGNAPTAVPFIVNGVYGALGVAALSDIKADYVRKAKGGTGEDGVKWKPLSPITIQKRRKGAVKPGEKKARTLKRLELKLYARLSVSMSAPDALAEAKRQAKAIMDSEDRNKLVDILLPQQDVEILRDTGVLLNSLSPGRMSNTGSYTPPRGEGGDEQVFEFLRGGVIVGTNVIYAGVHQFGDEDRNIPARPFLPIEHPTPQVWLDRWVAIGEVAVAEGIRLYMEAA